MISQSHAATSMKRAIFWDIAPCSLVKLVDISEVLTDSIIRAMMKELVNCPLEVEILKYMLLTI
jgi:hypothetical protein